MDRTVFLETIKKHTTTLQKLRKQGVALAAGIIGQSLTKDDFFFCASLDRCINLIDGFIDVLNQRNLTCAGALLRLQMDNCMRSYAAFIAKDKAAVIDCIVSGERINKQVSKDEKKLTDGYLKKEISKIDSGFSDIYDQASGYIHLSEKAFYQTIVTCENYHIDFLIGHALPEKFDPILVEIAEAFTHYVKLHYWILDAVVDSKKQLDSLQEAPSNAKDTSNEMID